MIQSDFYPTSNTYATLEVTNSITNLNLTDKDVDPCRAYYMGKLKSDDIRMFTPKKFEIEKNELEPGKSIIKLTETNTPVWWGYTYTGTESSNQGWLTWSPTSLKYLAGYMQMINSAYAYYINSTGDITLQFRYYKFEQETVYETGLVRMAASTSKDETLQFTMEQFIDMMENDTEITVTFTIDNVDTDFTVKMSDFRGDGFLQVNADTYIMLRVVATRAYSFYFGDTTRRSILPFISMSLGDKYFASTLLNLTESSFETRLYFDYCGSDMDVENTQIVAAYNGYTDNVNYRAKANDIVSIFSKPFSLTWDDLRSVIDGTSSKHVLLGEPNNHVIFYSTSTSGNYRQVGLIRAIDPYDYYTVLCLVNKYRSSGTGGNTSTYDKTSSYYSTVALFNTDNSPKSERASYDGDYPNFQKQLRDWQKYGYNIVDDEFDPDEPPPEPGDDTPDDEPEDIDDAYGDGDEDQDDIVITAPSQFITQYILTSSQLRTVGANLWSSWVDPNTDVYKNFLFDFFQDTGTFNITAALDYIIALRVYPFNLAGMTTEYLGVSNGVYMGTGHTNFCPGTIPTLNTVIGYLDAGTLDVNLHVPYKDFRDLYNCSIMAFLPFCGTVELNPVEVIGKKLHAKYFIDFQSGACTAVIRVNNDGVEYTIASKSGQIGFMLPVSATNSGQLAAQYAGDSIRGIGTIGGFFFDVFGSVGRSVAGAASAGAGGGAGGEGASSALSESGGGLAPTETIGMAKSGFKSFLSLANQATDMLSRSGIDMPMLSGGAGAESLFMPPYVCLQVRRGKYAKPNNYPHSVGYYNLSSNPISYYKGAYQGSPSTGSNTGKGFCTFTGVDTSGLDCREDERAEILELLNTGIYL